jgi:hypothetical protein
VQNRLLCQDTCGYIKEFTLAKNLFAAPFVQNRLPNQVICIAI